MKVLNMESDKLQNRPPTEHEPPSNSEAVGGTVEPNSSNLDKEQTRLKKYEAQLTQLLADLGTSVQAGEVTNEEGLAYRLRASNLLERVRTQLHNLRLESNEAVLSVRNSDDNPVEDGGGEQIVPNLKDTSPARARQNLDEPFVFRPSSTRAEEIERVAKNLQQYQALLNSEQDIEKQKEIQEWVAGLVKRLAALQSMTDEDFSNDPDQKDRTSESAGEGELDDTTGTTLEGNETEAKDISRKPQEPQVQTMNVGEKALQILTSIDEVTEKIMNEIDPKKRRELQDRLRSLKQERDSVVKLNEIGTEGTPDVLKEDEQTPATNKGPESTELSDEELAKTKLEQYQDRARELDRATERKDPLFGRIMRTTQESYDRLSTAQKIGLGIAISAASVSTVSWLAGAAAVASVARGVALGASAYVALDVVLEKKKWKKGWLQKSPAAAAVVVGLISSVGLDSFIPDSLYEDGTEISAVESQQPVTQSAKGTIEWDRLPEDDTFKPVDEQTRINETPIDTVPQMPADEIAENITDSISPESSSVIEHTVEPGDTVWDILEHDPSLAMRFEDLTEKQTEYAMDALKDYLMELQETNKQDIIAMGISSGNIDLIRDGEKLSLIFPDELLQQVHLDASLR